MRCGGTTSRYTPRIDMNSPSGPLHDQWNVLPTLKSSSQPTIRQPGGPESQRLRRSGLVMASQTMRSEALKMRIITISRSVGVSTVSVVSMCVLRDDDGYAALSLSAGEGGSHFVQALFHAEFGHLHHLAHGPAELGDGQLRFAVAERLERHEMALVLRDVRVHADGGWIDLLAVLVRKVVDVFDAAHGVDGSIFPCAVVVLAAELLWGAHADERCAADAEVDLGERAGEAVGAPPLLN